MLDPIRLSSLVASRICHDLISPIGAIGNGVELMMMDSASTSPQEMALIMESAGHANARIRLFRVAFGLCGPDQRMARGEAAAILQDCTEGGRLSVTWDSPQDLARRDVKLMFLALMCLETAMIQGGTVQISYDAQGWRIAANAPRLRRDAALWDGLSDPAQAEAFYTDVAAGHVHFPLLALEAARQHRAIAQTWEDSAITLRL